MQRFWAVMLAMLLMTVNAHAQPHFNDRVGDAYEIRLESISETSGDGSSGHSRDVTTLGERVIAVRDNGIELEYDLPPEASADDRARTWQLPARVLKPEGGPLQLLNVEELRSRSRTWLDAAGLPETACGRWIFTWTAIKIECDPSSVLEMLAPFDLRGINLRDGAPYAQAGARGSALLRAQSPRADSTIFSVDLEVDAELVRRQRAETDVVVAELTRQEPLTLEAALARWAGRSIAGTIRTTFETDSSGRVIRRTTVTSLEVDSDSGSPERQTTTVTVQRRSVHN